MFENIKNTEKFTKIKFEGAQGIPSTSIIILPNFQNLEFFEISDSQIYFPEFFQNLVNCTKLTHLDFQIQTKFAGRFSSKDLSELAEISLKYLPKLEHLNLKNHGTMNDEKTLAKPFCELIEKHPSLKFLNISSDIISAATTKTILEALWKNNTITFLDIGNCNIDGNGIEIVGNLQKSKSITIVANQKKKS